MPRASLFESHLTLVLEGTDLFAPAEEALGELEQAKQGTLELEGRLRQAIEQIHGQLATEIRRANPNLDVWLDRAGNVVVRYDTRTRSLRLRADARTRSWSVGDTPFERQFNKYNRKALESEPLILAKAITEYFRNNYRTLQK